MTTTATDLVAAAWPDCPSRLLRPAHQLRGEADERQVDDARVAVVSSGGLTPSGAILLRADG